MAQQKISTPWHLWVLAILLTLFNTFAAVDYIATIFRIDDYLGNHPPEVLSYYFNAPIWMKIMWGVSMVGGFIGAMLFLLRRAAAVIVTAISWVASVVAVIYTIVNPAPMGSATASIIILIIALLIVFYMAWMKKRGVLR